MDTVKRISRYITAFVKWITVATAIGIVGGVVGSVFHKSIDYATELRIENGWLIFFLPLGGVLIAVLYGMFKSRGRIDTNRVLESVRTGENVPFVMTPLIFIGTVITHLLGGSAGREGAALQIGGSIGYNMGRAFRLKENDLHIIVMAGMSSVFTALFGTPLTAAFFAIEVVTIGVIHYAGIVPCLISAVVSYKIATMLGVPPTHFGFVTAEALTFLNIIRVIALTVMCAVVSILFCTAIKKAEEYAKKFFPNQILRAFIGGAVIVLLTILVSTRDYNGAGVDVIDRALRGEARYEAFILKIVFTALTIAAGFKGGEIVPTFFIGSTFGCIAAPLLGLDAGFGAAIGFIALFCSVVNCPVASVILALEVFGADGIILFAIACGVSYMMSGSFGLYKSQKIVYSKLNDEYQDISTK